MFFIKKYHLSTKIIFPFFHKSIKSPEYEFVFTFSFCPPLQFFTNHTLQPQNKNDKCRYTLTAKSRDKLRSKLSHKLTKRYKVNCAYSTYQLIIVSHNLHHSVPHSTYQWISVFHNFPPQSTWHWPETSLVICVYASPLRHKITQVRGIEKQHRAQVQEGKLPLLET